MAFLRRTRSYQTARCWTRFKNLNSRKTLLKLLGSGMIKLLKMLGSGYVTVPFLKKMGYDVNMLILVRYDIIFNI